eukprot:11000696-Ditylum_brightwellii.AAC.1
MDLLGGEALDCLTKLSAEAPPLTKSNSYQSVLSCNDTYKEDDDNNEESLVSCMGVAAIEARRLLFLLLSDPQRSPFLVHLRTGFRRAATSTSSSVSSSFTHLQHHLARSIASLTIGGGDKRGGRGISAHYITTIPARAFVVHCISQTPELLSAFFRVVPTSEPKPTFRCMSSFACILHLMKECPPSFCCLPPCGDGVFNRKLPPKAEEIMPYIVPMSTTKTILSKGIQSTNALLVSEALKLIAATIERSRVFIENVKSSPPHPTDKHNAYLSSFSDTLRRRLPDVQPLLAIRTRFDPFIKSTQDGSVSSLSDTANIFAKPVLQYRLLKTLQMLTSTRL